jgi:hypothetical protein
MNAPPDPNVTADIPASEPAEAGLRDKAALAELPAEERAACERLWADVAALLMTAEEK